MAPETGTALLLLAAFVLPGFVTLLVRERTYVIKGQDSQFERLLNALYYSSIIYAVLGLGLAVKGFHDKNFSSLYAGHYALGVYLLLGFLALFILPFLIAELGRRWQSSEKWRPGFLSWAGIDPGHGVPAGWEQLFLESPTAKEGRGLMLRITLDDGRVVGGKFGEKSLAGYTAHRRDLFVEERWILDDENEWFTEPAAGTGGLWISEDQIHSIEVYRPGPESPQTSDGERTGS
jgi:Family of unknown function (DUF6338)